MRVTPETFLEALAPAYARREESFTRLGFGPTREAWLSHAARLGEQIRARTGHELREGLFETVDAHGALVLKTGSGRVAIPAAEVFF